MINPVYVFGPQAFEIKNKSQLNTSSEIINGLLNSKPDSKFDNLTGYFIDVRDVAKAHIVAFEKDSIQGQRLILAESPFSTQSILDLIRKDFPQLILNYLKVIHLKLMLGRKLKVRLRMKRLENYLDSNLLISKIH